MTRVAIIGTGLIGGSLGMALRAAGAAEEVAGFDLDQATLQKALARGAVTTVGASARDAARGADFVFVATPVGTIAAAAYEIAAEVAPNTVVTDVGSTKSSVVAAVGDKVGSGHFIGGHPIAGSEQEGIDAADAGIFAGAYWILTPTPATDPSAYSGLVRLLGKLGVKVLSLDAARHDETVALSSHLPQVISSAFMSFAAAVASDQQGLPILAAGGFRDLTRIAASSPSLWVGILKENNAALQQLLAGFVDVLGTVADSLGREDWEQVGKMLTDARQARLALPGKTGIAPSDLVEITVPVPDRPGVLAEVTTTVGEAGVNIEDIDIVHSAEGGRGTIYMTVDGADAAAKARAAIAERGYRSEISTP